MTFRYRPGSQDILKRINLHIRPGEVVGIVGASGSGKSTLTKLIQRLYLANEGQVLLDGMDISQTDPAWPLCDRALRSSDRSQDHSRG
ncbi:UNVERIFIED_ORG: ABC-type bacteriocin/lantibiotic exporter with double-glycine peptidase domain [Rhizobium esperanzae]